MFMANRITASNSRPFALWRVLRFSRLRDQVEKMLSVSPSSYVMVSSYRGVFVVPAIEVKNGKFIHSKILKRYPYHKLAHFISQIFVPCYVGDEKISMAFAEAQGLSELIIAIKSDIEWGTD